MYKLPYFTEEDESKVLHFMKENSFAIITGSGNDFPVATHIPLEIESREGGKIFFSGHLMKNTDHHKAFENNENVLVVFNGPHTYVSASWYSNPAVASTWNYLAVHAKGKIRFTDEEGTYNAIRSITNKYEGISSVSSFDKLPKEYVMRLIKGIVGFEIEVISFDNVFKLSQNHDAETRKNIAEQLYKKADDHSTSIADKMKGL